MQDLRRGGGKLEKIKRGNRSSRKKKKNWLIRKVKRPTKSNPRGITVYVARARNRKYPRFTLYERYSPQFYPISIMGSPLRMSHLPITAHSYMNDDTLEIWKRAGKTKMEAAHSNHPTPLGIKAMNNNTNKRVRGCNNRIVIKQTSNKTNGTCRSTVHQWISLNIGSNRHGKLKVCWKIRFDTQIIPFDMNWVLITFHQQVVSPSLQILYKGMETNNYDVQFFNLVHIITVINWIGTSDN